MRISDWISDVCSSDLKIDPKTQQLLVLKNKVSAELMKEPALMDVASYFKLDLDRLKKHSTQHHYRETVRQFITSKSHFKERQDRKSVVKGKSVSVLVDIGVRVFIKNKITTKKI